MAASRRRSFLPLVALLLVAGVVVWFMSGAKPEPHPEASRAAEPPAVAVPARPAEAPAGRVSDRAAPAVPQGPAEAVPAKEEAPRPPEGPATAPVEAPRPLASAPAADKVAVLLNVRPPHARVFRHGKEVGTAPVTIELAPGERRFFEVGAPGYRTRKVIVDGSERELTIGLRPVEPMSGAPLPSAN